MTVEVRHVAVHDPEGRSWTTRATSTPAGTAPPSGKTRYERAAETQEACRSA
ncbi:hypothetical protein [Streptosporangium canum]|uniref:hypothetical protein n=1 Tax=Streptosporangium canum TaxID=324952 RepID=UPI00341FAD2F